MLLIIIITAVFVAVSLLILISAKAHWTDVILCLLFPLLGGGMLSLIISIIIGGIIGSSKLDNTVDIYESKITKIEAFTDASKTSGKFFLFIGCTNDDLEYRFLVKRDDGLLEYKTIKAKNILVDYSLEESETPYIEVIDVHTELKPKYKKWFIYAKIDNVPTKTVLHINRSMIATDNVIDLK